MARAVDTSALVDEMYALCGQRAPWVRWSAMFGKRSMYEIAALKEPDVQTLAAVNHTLALY